MNKQENQMKETEYNALRQEILFNLNQITLCAKILTTAVCGIWYFSYDKDFFLVTIAYAMIIFIQCASSNFLKNMICVGMYIYVFIEDADENYAWETSLLIRDIKLYRSPTSSVSLYIILSIITFIFSIINMIKNPLNSRIIEMFDFITGDIYEENYMIYNLSLLVFMFIFSVCVIFINRFNCLKEKEKHIAIWRSIKHQRKTTSQLLKNSY